MCCLRGYVLVNKVQVNLTVMNLDTIYLNPLLPFPVYIHVSACWLDIQICPKVHVKISLTNNFQDRYGSCVMFRYLHMNVTCMRPLLRTPLFQASLLRLLI